MYINVMNFKTDFSLNDQVIHFNAERPPRPGDILIASTALKDHIFKKTVLLVCAHDQHGSVALVLNRSRGIKVSKLLTGPDHWDQQLFEGGPVQPEVISFIHRRSDIDVGSKKIGDSLYWGGDYEKISGLLNKGILKTSDIRFFSGYAGWHRGQLKRELRQKQWYVSSAEEMFIFPDHHETLWSDVIASLGPKFQMLINYPNDINLN